MTPSILDAPASAAWAARYLKMNGKRKVIGSFVHGSMSQRCGRRPSVWHRPIPDAR